MSLKEFGNKLRVRVCGICLRGNKLLLIKHESLGKKGYVWIPPGGGAEFGSNLGQNLVREFKEETGLEVEIGEFLFVHEFLAPPLHALEFFFVTKEQGGTVQLGNDPELSQHDQIISDIRFLSFKEINGIHIENKHQIFQRCRSQSELLKLKGYFNFEKYSIK